MKTLFLAIAALLFVSCSSGNSEPGNTTKAQQQSPAPAYDNSLPKGKVTDSVICKEQSGESYALYLPSYYTPDKKFPCIYLFDSHARGSMPVRAYKDLAEKYGFILVGSNVSKNGMQWPATNEVVQTLMNDSRARINIDSQRIYTGGFSGGSRVASSVAILDGGVAGVIGCAAGFPRVEELFQKKFDYFGMVGDYDFNYIEMVQLGQALEQNGFPHQLLTFEGKHDWPASADFQTALLWIQVNAIKKSLQAKSDSVVAAFKNDYDHRISSAAASHDFIGEHDLLAGIVNALSGLSDITSYKKQLDEVATGNDYKNAATLQTQLQQTEQNQQQELAKQFTTQDEKWWAAKIAALKKTNAAKSKQEAQMNKRLVNFTGLLGFLNASHALNTGDLTNAATYLKIFKIADPQNSDVSYLTAILYMKKGDQKQAISALNQAVSLDYSDISVLAAEPSFSPLQNDDAFKNILVKVRMNAAK